MKYLMSFIFIIAASFTLVFSQTYNLGMEKRSAPGKLPDGWVQWGMPSYKIKIDSVTRHSGKYALLIEAPDSVEINHAGCVAYEIPAKYKGKYITVKAFIKTESNTQPIGLMLNLVNENGMTIRIDNMMRRGIMGATDWKEYSVSLPLLEEAKYIFIGAILTGPGKLWVDDFRVLIDNKDLSKAKLRKEKYKATLDTEFNNASKIKIENYTPQMLCNLEILCRVWGFLKYYHPAIVAGNYNWDAELFRIMPDILSETNADHLNETLLQWINKFGKLKAEKKKSYLLPEQIKLYPDLEWINTEIFGIALTEKLLEISDSKRGNESYYYSTKNFQGVRNEIGYKDMNFDDDGLRLLTLFRYWNIIQYYFPYRYLSDWNTVLTDFIPKILDAVNEKSYHMSVAQLFAQIYDSHAAVDPKILITIYGLNRATYEISFIEEKAVIAKSYDDILRRGDIIESISGRTVNEIIAERLPYTSAANYPAKIRRIANNLLQTDSTQLTLKIIRNNEALICRINCISFRNSFIGRNTIIPKETYRLLSPKIGYFYPETINPDSIPKMMEIFSNTKGMIVDLRCYPAAPTYNFLNFLMSKPVDFAKISEGSISSPGMFSFVRNNKIGMNNENYYKGKVVIIVDGTTHSRGEYFAMGFQKAPRATVIGGTTSGANGNALDFTLPGGIQTMITGWGIYYPDGRSPQKEGIILDEEVNLTICGFIEGRDEILERAIKIIENE